MKILNATSEVIDVLQNFCEDEYLHIHSFMQIDFSGKLSYLKAFCVQKYQWEENINNRIFTDFQTSDDLQQSIKNCKTSNKLTVNMLQIIIQGKLFKDDHFILWKRSDEKSSYLSQDRKEKNHLHRKAERKSNKG